MGYGKGGPSLIQDYPTPKPVLEAIQKRYGYIGLDLAAHERNHVSPNWFGPGGIHEDSLTKSWFNVTGVSNGILRWLNPPYERITPWAKKARFESDVHGIKIAMLVPANISTNWFWNYVKPCCETLVVEPDIEFEGQKYVQPNGHILCIYGFGERIGRIERWDYRKQRKTKHYESGRYFDMTDVPLVLQ